jgi:hypothetical protein
MSTVDNPTDYERTPKEKAYGSRNRTTGTEPSYDRARKNPEERHSKWQSILARYLDENVMRRRQVKAVS